MKIEAHLQSIILYKITYRHSLYFKKPKGYGNRKRIKGQWPPAHSCDSSSQVPLVSHMYSKTFQTFCSFLHTCLQDGFSMTNGHSRVFLPSDIHLKSLPSVQIDLFLYSFLTAI